MVLLSLLLGSGLHLLHSLSRNALSLFVVALILPVVILMPRGQLLDWVSALMRNAISLVLLAVGWGLYRLVTSMPQTPQQPIGVPKLSPGEA